MRLAAQRSATFWRAEVLVIKLIALDLDGTVTQHRSPLISENETALKRLSRQYQLVMVCAGGTQRVRRQLNGVLGIDVIGYYGMELWIREVLVKNYCPETFVDRDLRGKVAAMITGLRVRFGLEEYAGESVEYHPSGVITFPLLGVGASLEEKLRFDPMRAKRRQMYRAVADAFPAHNVFIGGSSSFDLVPKPYDKLYALDGYLQRFGFLRQEVLYLGDDFGVGGNDEPIRLAGLDYITLDDYREFPRSVRHLFTGTSSAS